MAERKVLNRLMRLREMEEELSRLALESAVGDRNRVAGEMEAAIDSQAAGRRVFVAGVDAGDAAARTGAVIEMERARRQRGHVEPRLAAAELELMRQREEFLARRTQREQVETLVEQERQSAQEASGRRAQQMLDDWYGRRASREATQPGQIRGNGSGSEARLPESGPDEAAAGADGDPVLPRSPLP